MSKNSIIKGTLILTIAGFITRIIGFFYRIYLSNYLGAKQMGIYQLVFPVYSICFTLYASGIQTSLSRLVAAELGRSEQSDQKNLYRILRIGLTFSLLIAIMLSVLVYCNADFIAYRLLAEPTCSNCLRILAIVFPFCGITSCINGYYYGLKKAGIPATTQLLEQIIRVITVYMLAVFIGGSNSALTCEIAVLGLVIGEIASNIYSTLSLIITKPKKSKYKECQYSSNATYAKELLKQAVPLTTNRLLISVLSSIEAVLIPIMLREAGLTNNESLSVFGILTGMSIPFIMFPSTITNSFAVMLLPTVSEAQALGNNRLINKTTSISMKYSIVIGILSTALFTIFGSPLGNLVFHNEMAGTFITILAWLCPFIYLTTTLGSILNGLGKAHITFINSVIGLSLRIFCVLVVVPQKGITGYLVGLLISQLAISTLDVSAMLRTCKVDANLVDWIVKPMLIVTVFGYFTSRIYEPLSAMVHMNGLLFLLLSAFLFVLAAVCLLMMAGTIRPKEFKS